MPIGAVSILASSWQSTATGHRLWKRTKHRYSRVGLNSLRSVFLQNFGMKFRNAKEGFCRTGWFAATLLPILKRADRNSEQHRKGGLGKPGRQPRVCNRGDFGTMNTRTSTGLHFTHRRK